MKSIILFLFLSINLPVSHASEIQRHFKTDECTGYPEGTKAEPKLWAHCCVEHDLQMWAGGSKQERKKADRNLKSCVEQTGHATHAKLIYLGVRIGSLSPFKLKHKKWGHAWAEESQKDAPLSEAEVNLLKEDLSLNPGELEASQIEFMLEKLGARVELRVDEGTVD